MLLLEALTVAVVVVIVVVTFVKIHCSFWLHSKAVSRAAEALVLFKVSGCAVQNAKVLQLKGDCLRCGELK